jgi:hypothetical protein
VSSSSRNGSPAKIDDLVLATADAGQSTEQQLRADQQLLQLLADMNRMKRRCKHILDVTDRYCALRPGKLPFTSIQSYDRELRQSYDCDLNQS